MKHTACAPGRDCSFTVECLSVALSLSEALITSFPGSTYVIFFKVNCSSGQGAHWRERKEGCERQSLLLEIVIFFLLLSILLVIKRTGCVEMVSYVPFHCYQVFTEAAEGLWEVKMFLNLAKTVIWSLMSSQRLPMALFYGNFPDSVILSPSINLPWRKLLWNF